MLLAGRDSLAPTGLPLDRPSAMEGTSRLPVRSRIRRTPSEQGSATASGRILRVFFRQTKRPGSFEESQVFEIIIRVIAIKITEELNFRPTMDLALPV